MNVEGTKCQIEGKPVDQAVSSEGWSKGKQTPLPFVTRCTTHTLYSRKPAQEWNVYIDETGTSFSDEECGTEGRVVAVCVRPGAKLPNLGHFHSTDSSSITPVLRHCNTLLQSDCGILGFTRSALGIRSREGWLQAIRELVKWVWRLLPLQGNGYPVGLRFHVEQRSVYSSDLDTDLGGRMLTAELARENPERARQMRILSFKFADKNTPLLAWADVSAYLWGSKDNNVRKFFQDSGLLGTCLVSCPPRSLKICEIIFTGSMPDGEDWTALMLEKPVEGSLQQKALEFLQRRCQANPQHWKTYVYAMQAYLAGKQYSLSVLERMSVWLRPMQSPGLAVEFFWHFSELARLNHLGSVGSEDMRRTIAELERLTPEMGKLDPMSPLHVALRLAVMDSNAFDFSQAEARLAPWNPSAGGRLTGSALWDGKILSSLGQYRSFQNDPEGGIRLFEEALVQFDALLAADEAESRRQRQQTATYLAVARMDSRGADFVRVRKSVEEALGKSVPEAVEQWGRKPIDGSPYPHYLLARYLAYAGTDEDRERYACYSHLWAETEKGVGAGHPWPQIQYFRWLMTDEKNTALRRSLGESLDYARGKDNMPTVELIVAAVAIAMGVLDPAKKVVRSMLLQLGGRLPFAESIVNQLLGASPGDRLLAHHVFPFIFC